MMRIEGANFRAVATAREGRIVQAGRPVRWLVGKQLRQLLALAARWHWRVELDAGERAQLDNSTKTL